MNEQNIGTNRAMPIPLRGNRAGLIGFPVNALPPLLREMVQVERRLLEGSLAVIGVLIADVRHDLM